MEAEPWRALWEVRAGPDRGLPDSIQPTFCALLVSAHFLDAETGPETGHPLPREPSPPSAASVPSLTGVLLRGAPRGLSGDCAEPPGCPLASARPANHAVRLCLPAPHPCPPTPARDDLLAQPWFPALVAHAADPRTSWPGLEFSPQVCPCPRPRPGRGAQSGSWSRTTLPSVLLLATPRRFCSASASISASGLALVQTLPPRALSQVTPPPRDPGPPLPRPRPFLPGLDCGSEPAAPARSHPQAQALEEVHVWLRTLWLLTHQEQQRAAPARWHHRVAAHDGAQWVRLQLFL